MKKRTISLITGALLLVACNDDDFAPVPPDSGVVAVAKTLIALNTTDSAATSNLSDLGITDAGTDETSSPISIN